MSKKSMKQFNERKNVQTMQSTQPPKKVKKREVEAWILAIFMIAWTVCSVLGTIGFCRTQASADSVPENAIVQADSDEIAVEYSTASISNLPPKLNSPVPIPTGPSLRMDLPFLNGLLCGDTEELYYCSAGSYSLIFTGNRISLEYVYRSSVHGDFITQRYNLNLGDDIIDTYYNSTLNIQNPSESFPLRIGMTYSSAVDIDFEDGDYLSDCIVYLSDGLYFDYNVAWTMHIELYFKNYFDSSVTTRTVHFGFISDLQFGIVTYFNAYIHPSSIGSNWIEIGHFYPTLTKIAPMVFGSYDNGYAQGDEDGYNRGYAQGDEDGYNRGLQEGDEAGYDAGYEAGSSKGYMDGYRAGSDDGYATGQAIGFENGKIYGINHANEYTFSGLLGSVVDVPVTAIFGSVDPDTGQRIGGLLNFNILGVDLTGFFMSLLSVMIILSVVKLILP